MFSKVERKTAKEKLSGSMSHSTQQYILCCFTFNNKATSDLDPRAFSIQINTLTFIKMYILTHMHNATLSGVRFSCSESPYWVSTGKSIELGWPGLGAAGTNPKSWYKH